MAIKITENITTIKLGISETGIKVIEQPSFSIKIEETPTVLKVTPQPDTVVKIQETVTQVLKVVREGPRGPQGAAGTEIEVEAAENISALKVVRALNATQVVLADSTMNFVEARCLGMAVNAITTGNTGLVIFFGAVEDPSFSYAAGEPLFLTQNGSISDVQDPLSVYNSTIGHGLGVGAIFIDLQEPIEL